MAEVTVYAGSSLPIGTTIWSYPGNGSGMSNFVPAVPSPTGVADVFAQQGDGSVQAITTDGTVAWSTNAGQGSRIIPDFAGGAIVFNGNSISRLDGITGQSASLYTPSYYQWGESNALAVHTDGTIFTTEYTCLGQDPYFCQGNYGPNPDGLSITGIDQATHAVKFKVPTDVDTFNISVTDSFCYNDEPFTKYAPDSTARSMIIGGDGYAYFAYSTWHWTERDTPAANLPYPRSAYTDWLLLFNNTSASNFNNALGYLSNLYGDLQLGAVPDEDPLRQALIHGDQSTALSRINGLPPGLYHPCNSTVSVESQMHLLRVGVDGSSKDTVVKRWSYSLNTTATPTTSNRYSSTTTRSGYRPFLQWSNAITDRDQGALFSWSVYAWSYCASENDSGCAATIDPVAESHLTMMTAGSISSDVGWNTARYIEPDLQLQDGSYVGLFDGDMGRFDASGSVRWIASGYSPSMATADGGVLADDGTKFDANGSSIGYLPNLPKFQSWLGKGYQFGSVEQIAFIAPSLASTFAALQGGNHSDSGTAVKQTWFPPLPSCPGAQTPCAGEAVWNALKSLKLLVAGPCTSCDSNVFSKLSKNRSQFKTFLDLPPLLSDGTKSNAPMNKVMCAWYDLSCPFGSETVAEYIARKEATAISRTPSTNGIVIFVNPVSVCKAGTSPGTILNEALVFHEALHGFTGLVDLSLANALGVSTDDYNQYGSASISYYLEANVLGGTLHYYNPGDGNGPLVCQN